MNAWGKKCFYWIKAVSDGLKVELATNCGVTAHVLPTVVSNLCLTTKQFNVRHYFLGPAHTRQRCASDYIYLF